MLMEIEDYTHIYLKLPKKLDVSKFQALHGNKLFTFGAKGLGLVNIFDFRENKWYDIPYGRMLTR